MNVRAQWISLWMTPFFGVLLLTGFLAFPGFLPPMSPGMSAEQVAAFYTENSAMIRFSMIMFNLCGILLIPFFMVIVIQIKRMATPSGVLAYCYLSAAATGATVFAVADIFWLVAAYRPERDPQLTMLLNDMAWLMFTAPVGMLVVQNLVLALAVYLDMRSTPVFPRWVIGFSLVIGAAMTPAAGAVIFRTGPLAWDGAVSFWLKIGAFSLYLVVMFFVLRAAIKNQAATEVELVAA
ncbi:hypothetical protein BH09ACT8_BH09ACT8_62990 [soil metagenome]